jgi:hypothetical protein
MAPPSLPPHKLHLILIIPLSTLILLSTHIVLLNILIVLSTLTILIFLLSTLILFIIELLKHDQAICNSGFENLNKASRLLPLEELPQKGMPYL